MRSWLLFVAVMGVLAVISGLIVYGHHQQTRDAAEQAAKDQLSVLHATLLNALNDGEYDQIQVLFDEWGKHRQSTVLLELKSKSGVVFARYQRAEPAIYPQALAASIKYGYRGQAELSQILDARDVVVSQQMTLAGVSVAYLIVLIFGAMLMSSNRRRAKEAQKLLRLGRELNQQNSQLEEEHALLEAVIDSIPDLIYFKNPNGAYRGANKAFCDFHGLEQAGINGRGDKALFAGCVSTREQQDLEIAQSCEAQRQNVECKNIAGQQRVLDAFHTPYYDRNGNLLGVIGVERDITKLLEYQENLENLAFRDPLTGLANRRFLIDRMQQDMSQVRRHGGRLAVCAIDLDGFKPINDTYGHEFGDKVIVGFSQRLQELLREIDTVARWGGDEFTVLLNDIGNSDSHTGLIRRIMEIVNAPFRVDDVLVELTASMGITVYPDDDTDPDTLLRHADQAMYQSKQSGKNTYTFFDAEQDRSAHVQNERLNRFLNGLSSQELCLHYQPQIDMQTGDVHGLEALVRWQHPDEGLLLPGQFLPLIEGLAFSIELDWWVLEAAMRQLEVWVDDKQVPHVSVNVAAMTLQQPAFAEQLAALLLEYPHARGRLELEILETSALEEIGRAHV